MKPKKKNDEVKKYISSNETLGEIVDFIVELARAMLVSGANLERVTLAVEKIAHAYGLRDVCPYMLSTIVAVSARSGDGTYCFRQISVPPMNINLERLRSLNRLSYSVCESTPDPAELKGLLIEAKRTPRYNPYIVLAIRAVAMGCMSFFFGAGVSEMLCVMVIVVLLQLLNNKIEEFIPEHMLFNLAAMFIASSLAMICHYAGLCSKPEAIIITMIMVYLPGIPLVNAARNLFCGNEMNGILQILKALLETAALATGIVFAYMMFPESMEPLSATSLGPAVLIALSFAISCGLGAVFGIVGKDILLAGMCGAFCRVVMLIAMQYTSERLSYVFIATFAASFLAEVLATYRLEPSTYLIYPSIIPLIPGDLFFYMILAICLRDEEAAASCGTQCLYALIGMSVGFMLSSVFAIYFRRIKFIQAGGTLPHMIRRVKETALNSVPMMSHKKK